MFRLFLFVSFLFSATSFQAQKKSTAYFAGGCFWCLEAIFETVRGVYYAESGYAGGKEKNPSYQEVSRGYTGHAETVKVVYNPNLISFEDLLRVFFNAHDPSTKNAQGPDVGTQYRSMVFFQNEKEKNTINAFISALHFSKEFSKITTEVSALEVFYKAEEYHQDFEKRNPNNPYVRAVSKPRLSKFKKKSKSYLKD